MLYVAYVAVAVLRARTQGCTGSPVGVSIRYQVAHTQKPLPQCCSQLQIMVSTIEVHEINLLFPPFPAEPCGGGVCPSHHFLY